MKGGLAFVSAAISAVSSPIRESGVGDCSHEGEKCHCRGNLAFRGLVRGGVDGGFSDLVGSQEPFP